MRLIRLLLLALQTLPVVQGTSMPQHATAMPINQLADLAHAAYEKSMEDLQTRSVRVRLGRRQYNSCTRDNIKVRREWGSLTKTERSAYISAIQCLQAKPAFTPESLAPGAKTRFDDCRDAHQPDASRSLHGKLPHLASPYWGWSKIAQTSMESSPIFDGSDTSMSGNGSPIPNQGEIFLTGVHGSPGLYLPPGPGGGCVTSGPFQNMIVNLGPVNLPLAGGTTIVNNDSLAYNPRCLKRDLTTSIVQEFANASSILYLIMQHNEINDFQMHLQGTPDKGDLGVHGGGHYAICGDPGRDASVSPGDPAFYLHHAMVDQIRELVSTLPGPFCYVYL
ncbi:uncharacterized protein BCR38DRAFT_503695 [Pseudomassariella vexata]|uniref:Tyrosinase copper-binding domain-containing protein n=1 Tax=Pseudomassariella vexata TaxID=1141098 RepID=A0A1Y2EFI0_9PEZI|nr:uncharacterized protein BCR38DRAFT_503695 [Pseudomassariella vexata]ORY70332.1 hypothetical protein BCR38DRAFT_503695 [Pseudomassariella vexata]